MSLHQVTDTSDPTLTSPPPPDTSRRDQLVLENLALVRSIAARVYENLPTHMEFEDLVNAGILGLIDAAQKFDDSKQVIFRGNATAPHPGGNPR